MMESEHTCSFKVPFCNVNCTPSDSRFADSTGFRGFHCARTVLALHGHRSVNRKSKLRKRIIRIPPICFEQTSPRPRSVFSYMARGVGEERKRLRCLLGEDCVASFASESSLRVLLVTPRVVRYRMPAF